MTSPTVSKPRWPPCAPHWMSLPNCPAWWRCKWTAWTISWCTSWVGPAPVVPLVLRRSWCWRPSCSGCATRWPRSMWTSTWRSCWTARLIWLGAWMKVMPLRCWAMCLTTQPSGRRARCRCACGWTASNCTSGYVMMARVLPTPVWCWRAACAWTNVFPATASAWPWSRTWWPAIRAN